MRLLNRFIEPSLPLAIIGFLGGTLLLWVAMSAGLFSEFERILQ